MSDSFLLMKNRFSAGSSAVRVKQFAWTPVSDGHIFELTMNEDTMFTHSVYVCWGDISEMKSCAIAMQEVLRDSCWSGHIGKFVGCTFSARTLREDTIFMELLDRCLSETGNFEFCEYCFCRHIDAFDNAFVESDIEYSRVTLIPGLELEENIEVSSRISLERLTSEGVAELIGAGLIGATSYNLRRGVAHSPGNVAIVTRYLVPKVICENIESFGKVHNAEKEWNRLNDEESIVVDLLSLVTGRAITPTGSLEKSINPLSCLPPQPKPNGISSNAYVEHCAITREEANNFQRLLKIYTETVASGWPSLSVALKRYSTAMSRKSLDDKVIDMMISAEAIFLGDNSELAYKLSLRAATLLGHDQESKQQIFSIFKTAYSLRSKIVHGILPVTRDHRDYQRHEATVDELSKLINKAIVKVFEIADKKGTKDNRINWEDMLLS